MLYIYFPDSIKMGLLYPLFIALFWNSFKALVVIFVWVSWVSFGATRDRPDCKDMAGRSAVESRLPQLWPQQVVPWVWHHNLLLRQAPRHDRGSIAVVGSQLQRMLGSDAGQCRRDWRVVRHRTSCFTLGEQNAQSMGNHKQKSEQKFGINLTN